MSKFFEMLPAPSGKTLNAAAGSRLPRVPRLDGKAVQRPKYISELPRELQQNIEKITVLPNGRAVPQLYSKLAASQELRKMLNFGRTDDRNDLARLSDAELIAQLSDMAKELGIKIDLNYSFAQLPPATEEPDGGE